MSDKFTKDFIHLINDHQQDGLCPYYLSKNTLVTFQMVIENPHLEWCWQGLSENPNMTWDIIQQNPEKPWSWLGLSRNPNIGWDILSKRYKYYFGHYYQFMIDGVLDDDDDVPIYLRVHTVPDNYFDIDWNFLSKSSKTPFEMLFAHPNGLLEKSFIGKTPSYYGWDINGFALNPNITSDYLHDIYSEHRINGCEMNESYFKLCWWNLSMNESITWEMISSNPKCKWIYSALSSNPNITWDIVTSNSDIHWDYGFLCRNPSITWDIIQQNSSKLNQYFSIAYNPNITVDIIRKHPHFPWHYGGLSFNENLTIEFVEENLDKPWNWQSLCSNPFKGSRKKFIVDWVEEKYIDKKKALAKYVADSCQEWWYSPDNKVTMGLCEKMWKKRVPIINLYGQTELC